MKESSQKFENKETFDFDEFLSNNQFPNINLLQRFLKDIYRELSNTEGLITLETFREFINLPSFIADKIFKVFEKTNTKTLNSKTFLDGMMKLYNGDFQNLTKFIFDFYDFDKDGNIVYEDVNQIQLLILPSQHHSEEVFNCIKDSLDSFFEDNRRMSYENFVEITENFNSDIFMNLLIYLYTNKPFSNEIVSYYNSDKRLGEEAFLSNNNIDNNNHSGFKGFNRDNNSELKKFGLKKMQTECDAQEKRKSFSISKQDNPLFNLSPKDSKDNKTDLRKISENDVALVLNNTNNNAQKGGSSDLKLTSMSSGVVKKNLMSKNLSVNIFHSNDDTNKYSNNFDNQDSCSSNNFPSPKFATRKVNKISINYDPNNDIKKKNNNENNNEFDNSNNNTNINFSNSFNNMQTQENSYANAIQKNSHDNSNLTLPSPENFNNGIKKNNSIVNNNNSLNSSKNNSKKNLHKNKTKMKIKSPKNSLYLKGIRQNLSRMVTYSDAQQIQDLQAIIKEEKQDNYEENDPDYDEYEAFMEPPADEKTEIHDVIVVPQMPSIKNLFMIFRKMLSRRDEEKDFNGNIGHKRSLTEDDFIIPKIQSEATNKFTNKLGADTNRSKDSQNPEQDPSVMTITNYPMGSKNLTFHIQPENSKAKENLNKNESLNNYDNQQEVCDYKKNHNIKNEDFESIAKFVRKNTCASAKMENAPTINEDFINSFNYKTKSKKISRRTNSIENENQNIDDNNKNDYNNDNNNKIENKEFNINQKDKNTNNKSRVKKTIELNEANENSSDKQSQIEKTAQPNKRKVISKFTRSYTLNFPEKPELRGEATKNPFATPSKQNSNNNLSVNTKNNNSNNINNADYSNNSNNFGFFRRSSFYKTSAELNNNNNNNDKIPSQRGSQHDYFLSDESLMLKESSKSTYEAFINKYDQKKDKVIPYFILLNSKMMLYFKNDCKSRFRGLHYLSDAYATASYDKTQSVISNGMKHFYINLSIKSSVKWFVSKTEFEMRKWFEVLKKTINPHKSRQLKDYYLLKETLCEGKYGVVKRCINKKTKQEVSIKIINMKSLGSDPKKTELIYKEIEILGHCNHRSILKYIDHFIENTSFPQEKSYVHIVMEYLSGGDLAAFISKNGALHEARLVAIAWEIAKGLEYLHKLGVIHRDIKPENIVFDALLKPRIVDFGLSQIIQYDEFLSEPYGTYFYASPEIHNKTKYNKATDIWSFGMLLFYVLTSEYPFERAAGGASKEQAHLVICDLEREFDLERNFSFVNASRSMKDLIAGCLRKKMEQRYTIEQVVKHQVFRKFNGWISDKV